MNKRFESNSRTCENSLCPLQDGPKKYHLIVDHDVFIGILDHAYSDCKNEIIGSIAGHWIESKNIVHVTCFTPNERVIKELRPNSVEAESSSMFDAHGTIESYQLTYLGWYHSHPYIEAVPSEKDVTMQTSIQKQVPYGIGIICSPFMEQQQSSEAFYFNVFQVQESSNGKYYPVKMLYSINYTEYPTFSILQGINQTVKTSYLEAQAARNEQLVVPETITKTNTMEEKQDLPLEGDDNSQLPDNHQTVDSFVKDYFVQAGYSAFLDKFLQHSLVPSYLALHSDLDQLVQTRQQLEHILKQKLKLLQEKDPKFKEDKDFTHIIEKIKEQINGQGITLPSLLLSQPFNDYSEPVLATPALLAPLSLPSLNQIHNQSTGEATDTTSYPLHYQMPNPQIQENQLHLLQQQTQSFFPQTSFLSPNTVHTYSESSVSDAQSKPKSGTEELEQFLQASKNSPKLEGKMSQENRVPMLPQRLENPKKRPQVPGLKEETESTKLTQPHTLPQQPSQSQQPHKQSHPLPKQPLQQKPQQKSAQKSAPKNQPKPPQQHTLQQPQTPPRKLTGPLNPQATQSLYPHPGPTVKQQQLPQQPPQQSPQHPPQQSPQHPPQQSPQHPPQQSSQHPPQQPQQPPQHPPQHPPQPPQHPPQPPQQPPLDIEPPVR